MSDPLLDPLPDPRPGPLLAKALGTWSAPPWAMPSAGRPRWTSEQIRERYDGWVTGIVAPFNPDWRDARPIAPYHKGRRAHHRRHLDDPRALVDVYAARRDHLDAYAVAEELVPRLIGEKRGCRSWRTEALLLQRIFLAEKWLVARLHYGHVDPREAGAGNIVNCGAAMYMAPVGVVNAGDPAGAYAEAIEVAAPHQSSYGREAAGVLAAAVAAGFVPGATAASVVEEALALAHDGTRAAIAAVAEAASGVSDWRSAIPRLREAIAPFDTVGPD